MPLTSPVSFAGALGHDMADKRIAILREIGAGGSISQAARAVGVSYKAAWQALDTLTNLAGTPLVHRAVGGAGGGGAQLTDAGHQLLDAADAMAEARSAVLARWEGRAGPAAARLAVRTSMRNQWPCTVQRLEMLGQIVRVHLGRTAGSGDAFLSARITRESAELLGLAPGLVVQALCKATAVQVERAGADLPLAEPGVCRLPAKAVRVVRGETGDEVSAGLEGGIQMVGFAQPDSGLRAGSRVLLVVEDNAVVIALAQG
ncbi:TOBE domain-containing protein [Acidovorax sp.]|uniref:TOBE domain-containing protein n=1 Tax=Acidovorax sp. TaxID=1872122 RepID=UPI002ACE1583|nr:TOBE domain-containing protein [Acidovorax sp.]MDZ7865478.1 LysR family transcriptional regulator [Acidovorax sp.]